MDCDYVHVQCRRAGNRPCMGSRSGVGYLRNCRPRRYGDRQRLLGARRRASFTLDDPSSGRWDFGREHCHGTALPVAIRRSDRSHALATLAGTDIWDRAGTGCRSVLITVEYTVDPARAQNFVRAMGGVRTLRLRDGAYRWGLYNDPATPSRFVEIFVVESWAEHLRQHGRVTVADRDVEEIARAFHVGSAPPVISHLIYARPSATET